MSSHGNEESIIAQEKEADCSETTVEIKIKTLDSQTYTLRVNKYVPVPALKEQIATVTGVLSEQQRLICRGKVLKDDQLLSAYHVEDGHTLHLVVREPFHSSSTSNAGSTGIERMSSQSGPDPTASSIHDRSNGIETNSVVLGTFNISDQGGGAMSDINRVLSTVLASVGIVNGGTRNEGNSAGIIGPERRERMVGATVMVDTTPLQPDQTTSRSQLGSLHGTFRVPTTFSFGSSLPSVLPDSLTTISQYLSNLRQDFIVNGREHDMDVPIDVHNPERQNPTTRSAASSAQGGLPTPATLAEVALSVREFLVQDVGNQLAQLARQLQEEASVTDPVARAGIQSNAMLIGILLQNSGALLLELGRATMTLRMGQTASNAVVNAGPPVFISTVGPNPMMVQSLPSASGIGFGNIPVGIMQPGHALADGALGTGFVPRTVDVRIQTGSMTSHQGEHPIENQQVGLEDQARSPNGGNPVHNTQPVSGFPSFATESGRVHVVPIRTVVAAVPAAVTRPVADGSSSGSLGVFYPLLARIQNLDSGNLADASRDVRSGDINRNAETSQPSAQLLNPGYAHSPVTEMDFANVHSSVSSAQQQGGSASILDTPQEPSVAVPSMTSGDAQAQDNVASDNQHQHSYISQAASRFGELLHAIFGGEQMYSSSDVPVLRTGLQETVPGNDQTGETRQAILDQGTFLSQVLHQVMPFVQQHLVQEANPSPPASGDPQESPASANGAVDTLANSSSENVQVSSSTSQGERKRSSEGASSDSQLRDDPDSSPPGSKRQRHLP